MSKNTKIVLNIILVLTLVASFAWGTVVRGLGDLGPNTYSSWWNNNDLWANVCQFILPIVVIFLLILINKKK
jgi:hypothetical protein